MIDNFPAEYARTLNYTLGSARTFRISRDGKRVFYLRSQGPADRHLDLWYLELDDNRSDATENLLVGVEDLQSNVDAETENSEGERLRRERVREAASGITDYAIDDLGAMVAFSLNGDVYVKKIGEVSSLLLRVGGASFVDLSPDGGMVSYVVRRELYVAQIAPGAANRRSASLHTRPKPLAGVCLSSSPVRRCVDTKVTGGRRTENRCSSPRSTKPRSRSGIFPIRLIRLPDRA